MADAKATRFGVDDATRIHLRTLLLNAVASVESLAVALEMISRPAAAPKDLKGFSDEAAVLVESVQDLDERIRVFLELEEAGGGA